MHTGRYVPNTYVRAMLVIALVLSVVAGLAAWWLTHQTGMRFERELQQRLKYLTEQQAVAISAALWDLNRDSVAAIVRGAASDPDFVSVVVYGSADEVFVEWKKAARDVEDVLAMRLPVRHRDAAGERIIGAVELRLSRHNMLQLQREAAGNYVILFLWLLLSSIVAVALILRKIIGPLNRLGALIRAVAEGRHAAPVPYTERGDEIGGVARAVLTFITWAEENQHLQEEQSQMLEELRRARDHSEQASRVKSEFLAMMSHEMRTPLNGVIGMTQLLRLSSLDEEQQEYVTTIEHSGKALLAVINDVLDFSRLESGKLTLSLREFDLRETVNAVVSIVRPQRSAGVRVTAEFGEGVAGRYLGDEERIRQVLLNLVGNAVKFTHDGSVTIVVNEVRRGESPTRLRCEVRDTGIGIPESEQPRLFSQFTQVDSSSTRRYSGSGLGLAITRRLTELMGGEVGLESRPGVGSTFWFEIPLPRAGDG